MQGREWMAGGKGGCGFTCVTAGVVRLITLFTHTLPYRALRPVGPGVTRHVLSRALIALRHAHVHAGQDGV